MNSYRIRYDETDGTLEREGIVTPKGSRVVMHADGLLALKIAGTHYYGGQGQPQHYAGAEFIVCEEVNNDEYRERMNALDPPSEWWLAGGDVNGWLFVRERMKWPVRS